MTRPGPTLQLLNLLWYMLDGGFCRFLRLAAWCPENNAGWHHLPRGGNPTLQPCLFAIYGCCRPDGPFIVPSCCQSTPRWHGRCSAARSVPGATLSGLPGHNIHMLAAHAAFLWDIDGGAGPKAAMPV